MSTSKKLSANDLLQLKIIATMQGCYADADKLHKYFVLACAMSDDRSKELDMDLIMSIVNDN